MSALSLPSSGLSDWLQSLPPDQQAEIDALIAADIAETPWRPMVDVENPGRPTPQQRAFASQADIMLYGGAAGGGKTDLLVGLALMAHRRSILFRREYGQTSSILERMLQIVGHDKGRNTQDKRWILPGNRLMRWGGMQHAGDERDFQGHPYDLMGFDEVTEFLEGQFRFLQTWNRSTDPNQRRRIVCTSNPPTTAEGEWIIRYWAPWLSDSHPNPAVPGELRWFVSDAEGKDFEVDGPDPVTIDGETMTPRSRTFIPSSVDDNPFLAATGYKAVLQGLPEPLRSQMLRGDFTAGREDDPWQVCPTEWVKAAQQRWQPQRPRGPMSALGVDVAMGGRDKTILMPRYGDWYGEPLVHPGADTPDSRVTAGLIIGALRDGAPACIDVIGPGGEAYGHLDGQGVNVVSMNGAKPSHARDRSGRLGFVNKRAEWYWRMREALDPAAEFPIALPPDATLRADLCAPRWKNTPRGIQVEAKADIIKRLGRSTDYGDAAVYALVDGPGERRNKRRGKTIEVEGVSGYSAHRF